MPDDLEQFQAFAQQHLDAESYGVVANALTLYQQRQREIQRLREQIEPALAESRRGESKEIDFEKLKAACRQRLSQNPTED